MLRRLRLAPLLDDDRVLVAVTVGGRLVRQVRHLAERGVARRLGGGELLLGRPQLLLDLLQPLELLRRRLAVELLLRPQLVDARHERAPALVCAQQLVERVGRAAARERGAGCVGIVAGCLQVDHRFESRV